MNHARISWLAALLVAGSVFPAHADSWYPRECRPDYACAPIEKLSWQAPAGGGGLQLVVTSKNGKAVVPQSFPVRESKDGRSHVCMSYDPFGDVELICLFIAPGP